MFNRVHSEFPKGLNYKTPNVRGAKAVLRQGTERFVCDTSDIRFRIESLEWYDHLSLRRRCDIAIVCHDAVLIQQVEHPHPFEVTATPIFSGTTTWHVVP